MIGLKDIVREHCLIEQVDTMLNDGKLTSKQLHWINTTDEDPEIDSDPISFDLMTGFFRYIKNPDEKQKLHCLYLIHPNGWESPEREKWLEKLLKNNWSDDIHYQHMSSQSEYHSWINKSRIPEHEEASVTCDVPIMIQKKKEYRHW